MIYVGDLSDHVTIEILKELFIQAGPIVHVNIPRDKVTNKSNGYGFVEFRTEEDARYASQIMSGIKLFGTQIKISTTTPNNDDNNEIGAKLYVGNLSPDVNDLILHGCFSVFGTVLTCRVVIDPQTNKSRGHGFVSYDNFESADKAKKNMHGQYLCGNSITVTFAYKSESRKGEKHGDQSERIVAPNKNSKVKNPKKK